MHYVIFIHSFVNEHLRCIHALATVISNEHQGTCILLSNGFVWIYAQEWDCWIIW